MPETVLETGQVARYALVTLTRSLSGAALGRFLAVRRSGVALGFFLCVVAWFFRGGYGGISVFSRKAGVSVNF